MMRATVMRATAIACNLSVSTMQGSIKKIEGPALDHDSLTTLNRSCNEIPS